MRRTPGSRPEIPSGNCHRTISLPKALLAVDLGRGRGGNCRWRGSGGGKFINRLAPPLPSPPLVAAPLGGLGGVLLPRAQAAKLPPTAAGEAPRRPQSRKNSKEPSQVQVCAFQARQPPPPPPSRAVCPKALCKIKPPCFPRLVTPGFPEALLVRGRIPERRPG